MNIKDENSVKEVIIQINTRKKYNIKHLIDSVALKVSFLFIIQIEKRDI